MILELQLNQFMTFSERKEISLNIRITNYLEEELKEKSKLLVKQ